jgi:hypothetical protein
MAGSRPLYFVCDGPPGPTAGRFVDVEDATGANPAGGSGMEWSQRDGYWLLGPFSPRIVELETFDDVFLAERGLVPWSEPSRPVRVVIATEPGVHKATDLPLRLVADADYVIAVGGVMKDRDARFRGRVDLAGDVALQELVLEGPVEYVRWPA